MSLSGIENPQSSHENEMLRTQIRSQIISDITDEFDQNGVNFATKMINVDDIREAFGDVCVEVNGHTIFVLASTPEDVGNVDKISSHLNYITEATAALSNYPKVIVVNSLENINFATALSAAMKTPLISKFNSQMKNMGKTGCMIVVVEHRHFGVGIFEQLSHGHLIVAKSAAEGVMRYLFDQ